MLAKPRGQRTRQLEIGTPTRSAYAHRQRARLYRLTQGGQGRLDLVRCLGHNGYARQSPLRLLDQPSAKFNLGLGCSHPRFVARVTHVLHDLLEVGKPFLLPGQIGQQRAGRVGRGHHIAGP